VLTLEESITGMTVPGGSSCARVIVAIVSKTAGAIQAFVHRENSFFKMCCLRRD